MHVRLARTHPLLGPEDGQSLPGTSAFQERPLDGRQPCARFRPTHSLFASHWGERTPWSATRVGTKKRAAGKSCARSFAQDEKRREEPVLAPAKFVGDAAARQRMKFGASSAQARA